MNLPLCLLNMLSRQVQLIAIVQYHRRLWQTAKERELLRNYLPTRNPNISQDDLDTLLGQAASRRTIPKRDVLLPKLHVLWEETQTMRDEVEGALVTPLLESAWDRAMQAAVDEQLSGGGLLAALCKHKHDA